MRTSHQGGSRMLCSSEEGPSSRVWTEKAVQNIASSEKKSMWITVESELLQSESKNLCDL